MSSNKIPVYGKSIMSVEVEFLIRPCNRCGEQDTAEAIGNGHYCDECAEDIWENVGGQSHE